MACYWGKPQETSRYDTHPVVTGAALGAGMAGVQVGLVLDVQFDWIESGQSFTDECDAVGVHGC